MFDQVLAEVEEQCRAERVPMLGSDKAKLRASCVETAKPSLIVECRGIWFKDKRDKKSP